MIEDGFGRDVHTIRDMLWLLEKFRLYKAKVLDNTHRDATNILLVTRAAMDAADRRYNKLINARLNKRSTDEGI